VNSREKEAKASQNSGLKFNGRRTWVMGLVASGYLFMLGMGSRTWLNL